MLNLPPLATLLTFGAILVVVALAAFRLLWNAASTLANMAALASRRASGKKAQLSTLRITRSATSRIPPPAAAASTLANSGGLARRVRRRSYHRGCRRWSPRKGRRLCSAPLRSDRDGAHRRDSHSGPRAWR